MLEVRDVKRNLECTDHSLKTSGFEASPIRPARVGFAAILPTTRSLLFLAAACTYEVANPRPLPLLSRYCGLGCVIRIICDG